MSFSDASRDFGARRRSNNDLHATVLKLLGLDHKKLTFLFEGRDQRLTDVGGDHEITDRLVR